MYGHLELFYVFQKPDWTNWPKSCNPLKLLHPILAFSFNEGGGGLHLKKYEFRLSKNDWSSGSGEENGDVNSLQTDGQPGADKRW